MTDPNQIQEAGKAFPFSLFALQEIANHFLARKGVRGASIGSPELDSSPVVVPFRARNPGVIGSETNISQEQDLPPVKCGDLHRGTACRTSHRNQTVVTAGINWRSKPVTRWSNGLPRGFT